MLNERTVIISYFSILILLGACLLMFPGVWQGSQTLGFVDALFTSTSAVCVTGLIVVDTSKFSIAGQIIILLLIEAGGLGLVTFFAFFLADSKRRFSIISGSIIRDMFLSDVDTKPSKIIINIIMTALGVEAVGAVFLYLAFSSSGVVDNAAFAAIFHAVSAFCNAGFSTFPDSLERFSGNTAVNIIVPLLVIMGGIGFVVIKDLRMKLYKKEHLLSMHTKIVLGTTAFLIVSGTLLFLAFESRNAYAGMSWLNKIMAAFFQAVTCRTAGFDTVGNVTLSQSSVLFSIILMFIGASPGSTGGGIKTTSFFVLVVLLVKKSYSDGSLTIGNRKLSTDTLNRVFVLFLRALLIVITCFLCLVMIEHRRGLGILQLIFETVSAFGTVGLSLNTTFSLQQVSKIVVIMTMFMGRIGLFTMIVNNAKDHPRRIYDVPRANIMIG